MTSFAQLADGPDEVVDTSQPVKKRSFGDLAIAGDPQSSSSSTNSSLRSQVSAPMGLNAASAAKELADTQKSLQYVTDPSSKALLQQHMADLQATLSNNQPVQSAGGGRGGQGGPTAVQNAQRSNAPVIQKTPYTSGPFNPASQIPGTIRPAVADPADSESWAGRNILGPAEAVGTTVFNGAVAAPVGAVAGLGYGLTHDYGTNKGVKNADQFAGKVSDLLSIHPYRDSAQNATEAIGSTISPLVGAAPELGMMGHGAAPVVTRAVDAARNGTTAISDLIRPSTALDAAHRIEPTFTQPAPKPRVKLNADGSITPIDQPATAVQPAAAPNQTPAQPNAATTAPQPAAQPTVTSATAALAENNRIEPTMTEQPRTTAAPDIPDGLAGKRDRVPVLARVYGDLPIRTSVVNGDVNAAAGDIDVGKTARANDPGGILLQSAINNEKAGLSRYANDTVYQTGGPGISGDGGTFTKDEAGNSAKGQTLAAPVDAASDWFKQQYKKLYQDADAKSGGQPNTVLDGLNDTLSTQSTFAGKAENGALKNGIDTYLKEQKLVDENGNIVPMTAKQAEGLRQYMNSQWSPATKGLIGKMIDQIDEGVAKSAGEDVYAPARQLFAKKKQLFDNPNGMQKLFEFDERTPINRNTPFSQIPDKLLSLPAEQIDHIMSVYRNMPTPELQAMGNKAVQAVQAHAAGRVADIGSSNKTVWNQKGVASELNGNSLTHQIVFSDRPDILQRFRDIRDAGHAITAEDRSYPGASVQERSLLSRGFENVMDAGRQSLPAAALGLAFPATGGLSLLATNGAIEMGKSWKASAQAARSLKDAQSRVTRLSDLAGKK